MRPRRIQDPPLPEFGALAKFKIRDSLKLGVSLTDPLPKSDTGFLHEWLQRIRIACTRRFPGRYVYQPFDQIRSSGRRPMPLTGIILRAVLDSCERDRFARTVLKEIFNADKEI